MDTYEAILDFFNKANKPLKAAQIATETGIEKSEVDKVMKKLKAEGKIVSPKVCFWEIKK